MPDTPHLTRCPTPRKGQFQGHATGYAVIDEVPCTRWACLHCGPRKAFKLRTRIENATYNKFMTLTHRYNPLETREDALRQMRHDWHTLHKALDRYYAPKKVKYVAIVEWTKQGAPHLHILADAPYLPQRKLSAMWNRIHHAPIVDIRKVKSDASAARYVAKYLTKENVTPHRMRRWSASRGFLPPLTPYTNPSWTEEITWRYTPRDPITIATHAEEHGSTIMEAPTGGLVIIWPPQLDEESRQLILSGAMVPRCGSPP